MRRIYYLAWLGVLYFALAVARVVDTRKFRKVHFAAMCFAVANSVYQTLCGDPLWAAFQCAGCCEPPRCRQGPLQ